MSQDMMTVVSQTEIVKDIFELRLKGALVNEMGAPDQFLHIRVHEDELLLRRPISIAAIDADKEECVIIYPTESKGTTNNNKNTTGDA